MNILRLYTLACLLCPFGNFEQVEQKTVQSQPNHSYLCDCGYKNTLMWYDKERMMSTY